MKGKTTKRGVKISQTGGLWPPGGETVEGRGLARLDNHLLFQNVKVDVGLGGLSPKKAVPARQGARGAKENVAENEPCEPQARNPRG